MKILLINNFFYRKGGSETVFFNTADLLRNAGHEVVFFSFEDEHNIKTDSHEYFVKRGGRLLQLSSFFYNGIAAKALERVLKKERPDIAHVHLFWGGISPSIFRVLHKYKIPLVHTAHDYRMVCPAYLLKDGQGRICERCKNKKFYQCLLHRCSKGNLIESLIMMSEMYYRNFRHNPAENIDGIIYVSKFSKSKHIELNNQLGKIQSVVSYNCPSSVVLESFKEDRDAYGSYYLYYGRLSKEKGIIALIDAFEKFPHLQLKIVGTGPLEKDAREYCYGKKMGNVEFLGYRTGKELFDTVANAKFVLVPSECYENNPMTIVEAYAVGSPVIGARIGGIPEIIDDGKTGFCFESNDGLDLVRCIQQSADIAYNDYCDMRKNAFDFYENNFCVERHYERLVQFYKKIIENYK